VSSRAERRITGADVVFELLVSPFVDLIDYRVLDILLPFGNLTKAGLLAKGQGAVATVEFRG
jgi:hypothetical protein